jgi:hypothetical protein
MHDRIAASAVSSERGRRGLTIGIVAMAQDSKTIHAKQISSGFAAELRKNCPILARMFPAALRYSNAPPGASLRAPARCFGNVDLILEPAERIRRRAP